MYLYDILVFIILIIYYSIRVMRTTQTHVHEYIKISLKSLTPV